MMFRMIRHGMLAGFAFLLAVAVLEMFANRAAANAGVPGNGIDADVSTQMWHVLAEARRIVEESA